MSPAIYEAGFGSPSRVYERAASALGMSPATYGRGGRGATIRFTVAPTPLGLLLVAATDRGVCRISLGDSASALERDLRAEFPAATITSSAGPLAGWVQAIVGHLEGRAPHLDLPLDIRATAFQQRVWAALKKIPYGATRSYRDVAKAIRQPGATRAVARACATNPVAIAIPCHRVVREDGAAYDEANRDLASLIDEAIEPSTTLVDWWQKDDVQREMRRRIKRHLRAAQVPADQLDALALHIVDLVKVRRT